MSAAVITLADHRRSQGRDAGLDLLNCRVGLIERYITDVRLDGEYAERCRDSLNGILRDVAAGDVHANQHWMLIEKVMTKPLRSSDVEEVCERIVHVSSLAANYWQIYGPCESNSGDK